MTVLQSRVARWYIFIQKSKFLKALDSKFAVFSGPSISFVVMYIFGICYVNLIYFLVFWYIFFLVWYIVTRKTWQPCSKYDTSVRTHDLKHVRIYVGAAQRHNAAWTMGEKGSALWNQALMVQLHSPPCLYAGLPDFSLDMIPKLEKMYQMNKKCTKCS
jgi:hypothetical protein